MIDRKKYPQAGKLAGLFAAGILLSGCSFSGNLLGGAGLSNDVPTVSAQPTQILVPASTAIPETYGHIIFVSDRGGQKSLYITTPDGLQQALLTGSMPEDGDPHVSPDGRRVAFVSTVAGNADIYVLDLSTRVITRITDAPQKDSSPTWSPDGTRIAFESFRDGNFEIYMANADGSGTTRLTNDPSGDSSPAWSPVANEIAFVGNRFGNSDIFLLSPNGAVSTLTTNPAPDSSPAWSPDGSTIAFKTHMGELANLCVINRDALNQHCLTRAAGEIGSPVWSPDGKWVAASARQSAGWGISLFSTFDSSTVELYTAGIEPRGNPVWSPEGARLVFQAEAGGEMELYMALVPTKQFFPVTSITAYNGEPVWINQ